MTDSGSLSLTADMLILCLSVRGKGPSALPSVAFAHRTSSRLGMPIGDLGFEL